MKILAIDPGNEYSAYCVIDGETLRPLEHGKLKNGELAELIKTLEFDSCCIEAVACYGMPVGREVFETCEWTGRFALLLEQRGYRPERVYRREEKIHICGSVKAKDANIRRALIDRFAERDLKNGKGTRKEPDWFYGFKADEWAAYAVAITYAEREN